MGGSAPPPPDYTPIAEASKEQARLSYDIAKEQLAWAREQYANDRGIIKQVVDTALEAQRINLDNAVKDRARYEGIFQPLETQLARDAETYASPEKKELERGRSMASVAQTFDGARAAAQQQLESYGVDPTSTRSAALDLASRTQQAAAQAAAANQSDLQVDAQGRAMRSEAINVGRGYPAQVATQTAQTLQAGAGASGAQLAGTQSGSGTMGNPTQWMGQSNASLGVWGNALTSGYNSQMQQYNANQQSSSGFGSLLGATAALLFEGGGAVPEDMSPSGGAAVDDVPAVIGHTGQPARLNAGEYVIPRDVVNWMGEKTIEDMIAKARKQRDGDPGPKPGPTQAPTPETRATALPMR